MHADNDDLATLRTILAAGGYVIRNAAGWHDAKGASVDARDVKRLRRAGYLSPARSDKRLLHSTRLGAHVATLYVGAMPAVGVEITYRLPRAIGRGRVLLATADGIYVMPSNTTTRVDYVRRPHKAAPWKCVHGGGYTLGHFAPGGYGHHHGLWPLLAPYLPAAWHAPATGARHTLARLRSVRERLCTIGAGPFTAEEYAATKALGDVWYAAREERYALANLRTTVVCLRRDHAERRFADGGSSGCQRTTVTAGEVADYLDAVLVSDADEIFGADVANMRDHVGRTMNLMLTTAMRAAAFGRARRELPPPATLDEVMADMKIAPDTHAANVVAAAHSIILADIAAGKRRP